MYRIYFDNYYDRRNHRTDVGHCENFEDIFSVMNEYLNKNLPDWKVSYWRHWGDDNEGYNFDFGKYSQFFFAEYVDVKGESNE